MLQMSPADSNFHTSL